MINNSQNDWDGHEVFSDLTHTYQFKHFLTYDPSSQACSFTSAFLCQTLYESSYCRLVSHLTTLLPPALGFSPHPPVSVYGTGTYETIAAFLGSQLTCFATDISLPITSLLHETDLPISQLLRLDRSFHSRLTLSFCVPTVLFICSTGISTCYPSTTTLVLALGPDLPRADQLYSGNLGYSA